MKEVKNCPQKTGIKFLWRNEEALVFHPTSVLLYRLLSSRHQSSHHVRVSQEQVTLATTIDYTIKRAGVFALRLTLPAGYRLETVSGTNILQWDRLETAALAERKKRA